MILGDRADKKEKTQKPMTTRTVGDKDWSVEARGRFDDADLAGYVPTPESEHLKIDLPIFGGPLDLLLYLIKKHSMDIFDIEIVVITREYSSALKAMEVLNLDLAGEFILMAANLAQIKSKMLLPKEPNEETSDDEESDVDPRAELVKRLLEYQKFKDAAQNLGTLNRLGRDNFLRAKEQVDVEVSLFGANGSDCPELESIETFELVEHFAKALAKAKPNVVHAVKMERVNLRARIIELIDFARLREEFKFEDVLWFFDGKTKSDIILTFLAILETARMKLLRFSQHSSDGTIWIKVVKENCVSGDAEILAGLQEGEV